MAQEQVLLFDLDGTLIRTETIAVSAFRQTFARLREAYGEIVPELSEADVCAVFGKTLPEIWDALLPRADEAVRREADAWLLHYEKEALAAGKGELYPGVRETLQRLRADGYRLFIVSNGGEAYVDTVCTHLGLTPYFDDYYSAGRFAACSKTELVARLLREHDTRHGVMVGDRRSDVEAGRANGLKVVGCAYGYGSPGELDGADAVVERFDAIVDVLARWAKEGAWVR